MVDTLLSKFVKEFGDAVMQKEVEYLFSSVFVQTLIWAAFIYASIQTLLAIRRTEFSWQLPKFFAAWMACIPVAGVPLGFTILNNVSTAFSYKLDKMTQSILTSMGKDSSLPPGFVYNAIFRAASLEIEDPKIGLKIRNVIENCVPDVLLPLGKKDGNGQREKRPVTPVDLFTGKSSITSDGDLSYELPSSLMTVLGNRKFSIGLNTYTCSDYLSNTRLELATYIKNKNLTKMPENLVMVGSNNGETQSIGINDEKVWNPKESETAKNIEKLAANMAHATAIQKEVLKQYYDIDLNRATAGRFLMRQAGNLNPSIDLQTTGTNTNSLADVVSTTVFEYSNIGSSISKFLGLEGAVSNGAMLAEINQKMHNFPLYITGIQLILKLAFPIVCLLLFLTATPYRMLAWIWAVSLFTPSFINLFRSVSNSFHLYLNNLSSVADSIEKIKVSDPAYLFYGLNFDATNRLLEDATRFQQTMLSIELYLWGAIFMVLPAGAWLAKNGKAVIGRIASAIGYRVSNNVGSQVTEKVSENLKKNYTVNKGAFTSGAAEAASGPVRTLSSLGTGAAVAGVTFITSRVLGNKQDKENEISSHPVGPGRYT